MKHTVTFIAIITLLCTSWSCKTTEANYRAAYEKAIAGRDSATALDQTIYGQQRRAMGTTIIRSADGDTVEVKTQMVSVDVSTDGTEHELQPYNVVVGQFKQRINARSLCSRIVEAGYPDAFVVHTAEPYYYIILSTHATQAEAVDAAAQLRDSGFPFPLRDPLPFVLHTPLSRRK